MTNIERWGLFVGYLLLGLAVLLVDAKVEALTENLEVECSND